VSETPRDASRPRVRDYLVTPFFLITLLSILLVFHLLQVVARRVSVRLQEHMYDYLCGCLLLNLKYVARARFDVQLPGHLPSGVPVVFVSNHQSMFDIPLQGWYLRAYRPRFVAKRELSHGVPAISYALRTLGHALIDRDDARQSITAIKEYARALPAASRSAAIYPEGTRSRDGTMAPLKGAGLLAVLKELPEAHIVPMTIDGTWRIEQYRMRPVPAGVRLTLHVLPPVRPADIPRRDVTDRLDQLIRDELTRIRAGDNAG
jgi:1-acyl-sn-glycerol-3-phosphate acyltransferase